MNRTALLLSAAIAFANIQSCGAQNVHQGNAYTQSSCECQSVASQSSGCISGDCHATSNSAVFAVSQTSNIPTAISVNRLPSSYMTALSYQQMLARNPQLAQRVSRTAQMAATPVVQQIPVSTIETQTVDRGSWQMVWVAKPVQQQVVRTTMQNRIAYQAIPVAAVFAGPATSVMPTFASVNMSASGQVAHAPVTTRLPMYAQAQTYTASPGLPILSAPGIPEIPTFDDQESSGPWLTVPSQSADDGQDKNQTLEEHTTKAPVPLPQDAPSRRQTRKRTRSRLFEPVRPNSGVWQSQFTRRGSR